MVIVALFASSFSILSSLVLILLRQFVALVPEPVHVVVEHFPFSLAYLDAHATSSASARAFLGCFWVIDINRGCRANLNKNERQSQASRPWGSFAEERQILVRW